MLARPLVIWKIMLLDDRGGTWSTFQWISYSPPSSWSRLHIGCSRGTRRPCRATRRLAVLLWVWLCWDDWVFEGTWSIVVRCTRSSCCTSASFFWWPRPRLSLCLWPCRPNRMLHLLESLSSCIFTSLIINKIIFHTAHHIMTLCKAINHSYHTVLIGNLILSLKFSLRLMII